MEKRGFPNFISGPGVTNPSDCALAASGRDGNFVDMSVSVTVGNNSRVEVSMNVGVEEAGGKVCEAFVVGAPVVFSCVGRDDADGASKVGGALTVGAIAVFANIVRVGNAIDGAAIGIAGLARIRLTIPETMPKTKITPLNAKNTFALPVYSCFVRKLAVLRPDCSARNPSAAK